MNNYQNGSDDNQRVQELEKQLKISTQRLKLCIQRSKETGKQLKKEMEKEQKYLDVAGVMMVAVDPDQKVTLINRKGCEILGCRKEDILGKNWFDNFLPKEIKDDVKVVFDKLMAGKVKLAEYYENPVLTKDGKQRIVLWHNTILKDESGKIAEVLSSGIDITERKQAEEALQAANLQLQADEQQLRAANQQLQTSEQQLKAANQQLQADEQQLKAFNQQLQADEQQLRAANQQLQAANRQLRESEERLRLILEQSFDGIDIAEYDLETDKRRLVLCNDAYVRMSGRTKQELLSADDLNAFVTYPEAKKDKDQWREFIKQGKKYTGQASWIRPDGTENYYEWSAAPVKTNSKIYIIGIDRDITERKQTELKLLEYQKQLRSLASELSLAEERERRRIARELHDQISQFLVITKVKLESLRQTALPDHLNILNEVCESLDHTIQDIRSLTFDLSSPILHELGFEVAVAEWLSEQVEQKHGIETKFEDDGKPKPLSEDVCVILFRDVRELLVNVIKHAKAKKVKVSVSKVNNNIQVSVEDDGAGFEISKISAIKTGAGGFGFFSIKERLEQFGGHMDIQSELGKGTKVTLIAPLEQ